MNTVTRMLPFPKRLHLVFIMALAALIALVAYIGIIGADGGLISHWAADGDAQDSEGDNHGTLKNGTTFAPGINNQAFSFDGIDDLVLVPDSGSLNPTTAITLAAWVFVTGKQGIDRDIFSKDGELFDRQYLLTASNANRFRAHVGTTSTTSVPACLTLQYPYPAGTSGFHVFDGATNVQLNLWYHVAMTYDGSVLKLYVNGVLDGSCSVTGAIITTSQPVRIGGGAPTGAQLHFNGLVDDVKIYSIALSAGDIADLFEHGAEDDGDVDDNDDEETDDNDDGESDDNDDEERDD